MNLERTPTTGGRRVLIVNLTRLGDLLQTSPTIATLRERDPDVHITLLADRNFADVCEGIPGLDRILRTDMDELGRKIFAGGPELVHAFDDAQALVEDLRGERFDLALNFSSSRMTAVFMRLLRIPEVRGWTATPEGQRLISHPWSRLFATLCLNRHASDFNLVDHYRAIAGGGPGPRRLLFEPDQGARERAAALLAPAEGGGRLIAFQLGASRANRIWPTESFVRVGRELRADGCRILLVGGSKERELARAVESGIGDGVVDLCGQTDIGTLAAVLGRADMLVTGDTGPMHLASAMGTPIVGLFFGPALPFDTGPYGADHVLLHAAVGCAPCAHSVNCLDAFCRREITPEAVTGVVRARLAEDWVALDEISSFPGAVRLYRTAFDDHGLFECRRLGRANPTNDELLRRAYRAVWLTSLEREPLPDRGFPSAMDTTPFSSLAALAASGVETAGRLAAAVGTAAYSEIDGLGTALAELDAAIGRLGSVEPMVRPLTQMFRFEQESLEPGTVTALARATGDLYRELACEAGAMTQLLGAETVETRCSHAN